MGLQGSEGMSIRISRNLNICMLMSTRLRMGDTCNGKLKVYLYAYRIAKFHVFCKIIEFVCKNNIFNIVTTLGESASGQQWQIDIGTCTVRTRARRQRTISPCIYMMTICILMESQGSEGVNKKNANLIYICILMGSQGSEGDQNDHM